MDPVPALRLLDTPPLAPEEHLALEEAVLDAVETGESPCTLRLWESATPFVVLGSAQVLACEVDEEYCAIDGVPVMRRCTAGGCVLQGPGSLNYSLFLRYAEFPETRDLHQSYCFILSRIAGALEAAGIPARHEGVCDLAVAGLKVSGNAQRRRRNAFLHHGTLVHRADHAAMARYLREPKDRPAYRAGRTHRDFVGELRLLPEQLRRLIIEAFGAGEAAEPPTPREWEAMRHLVNEKYRAAAWIRRR